MPDIKLAGRTSSRVRSAAESVLAFASSTARRPISASVAVAGVAALLQLTDVGFDKVAGALVIVFAQRMAAKRLAPEVRVQAELPKDWRGFSP